MNSGSCMRPFQDCTERPAAAVVGSNGLMLVQALTEMKIELLKNHDFLNGEISQLCHVIRERMEVKHMISIDSHSVYHFGYPLF